MTLENLLPLKRKADEMHKSDKTQSGIAAVFSNEVDASLTWKFVDWVRTVTRLPIFVKVIILSSFPSKSLPSPSTDDLLSPSSAEQFELQAAIIQSHLQCVICGQP